MLQSHLMALLELALPLPALQVSHDGLLLLLVLGHPTATARLQLK